MPLDLPKLIDEWRQHLVAALDTPSEDVCIRALVGLGQIDPGPALGAVLARVGIEEPLKVRVAAIHAIPVPPNPEARRVLGELLLDDAPAVRWAALAVLTGPSPGDQVPVPRRRADLVRLVG